MGGMGREFYVTFYADNKKPPSMAVSNLCKSLISRNT